MIPPPDDTAALPDDAVIRPDGAAAGLDGAIARLFAAHADALRLYARQWVGAGGADDVVQRVFVRMVAGTRGAGAGRLLADPKTWLFRCVRNEAIAAWRTDRRRGRREQAVAADAATYFEPRPEDRVDARAAEAALRALPPADREIVTLRLWSGLTLAEIAKVTDLPISTVHDRYRAALAALRRQLEPSCDPAIQPKSTSRANRATLP